MAINRFAILTDGFAKPGTIVGSDWASKIGRALLITEGYFNRAFSSTGLFKGWIYGISNALISALRRR